MRTRSKTSGYIIRSASGILMVLALAIFSALIAAPRVEESKPTSPSPGTARVDIGDVAVDIGYSTIKKLSAADGTVRWSVSVTNDGALAVDPSDLGVYTGYGSHDYGRPGTVYKYKVNGSLGWTNSVSVGGDCNFYYVSYAAVDITSPNPGVVHRVTTPGLCAARTLSPESPWSKCTICISSTAQKAKSSGKKPTAIP